MAKYLKLGEKATLFFDSESQLLICGNEVVELEMVPKNRKITTALAQGHIVRASKEDYDIFKSGKTSQSSAVKTQDDIDSVSDKLIHLSDEDFVDNVQSQGFTKKDQKIILSQTSRETQISMYRKLEKNYD